MKIAGVAVDGDAITAFASTGVDGAIAGIRIVAALVATFSETLPKSRVFDSVSCSGWMIEPAAAMGCVTGVLVEPFSTVAAWPGVGARLIAPSTQQAIRPRRVGQGRKASRVIGRGLLRCVGGGNRRPAPALSNCSGR